MIRAKLYPRSYNAKTGPIPTSISSHCPPCSLAGAGCYAENWPLSLHWDRVKKNGPTWDRFCHSVAALPNGQLWRHNVAGDLPADSSGSIDWHKLTDLVEANHNKRGFTYTHHEPTPTNAERIRYANLRGFTINLSSNNPRQARARQRAYPELPHVTVLPIHPSGWPADIVVCPNHTDKTVTCATCEMCAEPDRDFIIGFPAHGTRKQTVQERTQE